MRHLCCGKNLAIKNIIFFKNCIPIRLFLVFHLNQSLRYMQISDFNYNSHKNMLYYSDSNSEHNSYDPVAKDEKKSISQNYLASPQYM